VPYPSANNTDGVSCRELGQHPPSSIMIEGSFLWVLTYLTVIAAEYKGRPAETFPSPYLDLSHIGTNRFSISVLDIPGVSDDSTNDTRHAHEGHRGCAETQPQTTRGCEILQMEDDDVFQLVHRREKRPGTGRRLKETKSVQRSVARMETSPSVIVHPQIP